MNIVSLLYMYLSFYFLLGGDGDGPTFLRRNGMPVFQRAKLRTLKLTFMIVVAFVFCWTPYILISTWWATTLNLTMLILFYCVANCNPSNLLMHTTYWIGIDFVDLFKYNAMQYFFLLIFNKRSFSSQVYNCIKYWLGLSYYSIWQLDNVFDDG